jgi:hypothetical protein
MTVPASLKDDLERLSGCFPAQEFARLSDAVAVLAELDEGSRREITECLRQASRSLPPVGEAILACPSILGEQRLGGRERSPESLIDALLRCEELNMEFLMPTGAILGRAFVLAKLNFLKALAYLLEAAGDRCRAAAAGLRDVAGDTVFSKLAEELLTGAISNPKNPEDLRRAAAQKLLVMWSDRLRTPIGEFQPVLRSAWRARGKVRAVFGTMIGVNEVFSLIQAECESRFVNYFARDRVTGDEREAFREFLFGLSYEELAQLQAYMEKRGLSVITPAEVSSVLSNRPQPLVLGDPSPERIYDSYKRRRIRAEYRALSGTPGPRKTAEGYIMESLLREGAE